MLILAGVRVDALRPEAEMIEFNFNRGYPAPENIWRRLAMRRGIERYPKPKLRLRGLTSRDSLNDYLAALFSLRNQFTFYRDLRDYRPAVVCG